MRFCLGRFIMKDKSLEITTEELWGRLFASPAVNMYLQSESGRPELPGFAEYITGLCRARNEKPERVIKRADIESSFGHRLFRGGRRPSRDTVLQLAFGFEMDTDEAQELLKVARHAGLHPKVKRDAVIAFCLHKGMSITQTQQYLYDNDMPLIGSRRSE